MVVHRYNCEIYFVLLNVALPPTHNFAHAILSSCHLKCSNFVIFMVLDI